MSLWMMISEYVEDQINKKAWPPGYIIPNETLLAQQFHVSRPTVRAALTKLEAQGLVRRIKGKGTIVQPQFRLEESTIILQSFAKEMKKKGEPVVTKVLAFGLYPAPASVAEKLHIAAGDQVIRLLRLRYIEGKFETGPLVYSESYTPVRFSFLLEHDMSTESLTQTLNDNDVYFRDGEKTLRPVILSDETAEVTGVVYSSLAILIETVWKDTEGGYAEYSKAYWPMQKNTFQMRVSV